VPSTPANHFPYAIRLSSRFWVRGCQSCKCTGPFRFAVSKFSQGGNRCVKFAMAVAERFQAIVIRLFFVGLRKLSIDDFCDKISEL